MRGCPKCLSKFGDDLNFCLTCGTMLGPILEEQLRAADNDTSLLKKDEIPQTISSKQYSWTCSKCGKSMQADLSICLNCGTSKDGVPDPNFRKASSTEKAVNLPVIGSGYSYLRDGKNGLQEPDPSKRSFVYWAERNLKYGTVDLVGIGRQSLADPLFAKRILGGEYTSIDFCTACGGCSVLLRSQRQVGCTVYDEYYREVLRQVKREARG